MDAPSLCVECEEIELANVQDARPSQVLPIPNVALAGFPEGRSPHELTRRRLLALGVAGFASVYGSRMLSWDSVWESAAAEAATSPAPRTLVMLYLAGGQDGLNVIVPSSSTDYPTYVAKRPALHRGQGPTIGGLVGSQIAPGTGGELAFANPLVSSKGGGDNGSSSSGFDLLYGDGSGGTGSNLALLPAVDYTPPNLSHFTSSDYWVCGGSGHPLDRMAGALSGCLRVGDQPAPGNLDRARAVQGTAHRLGAGVAITSLSSLGFRLKPGYGSPGGDPTAVNPNSVIGALAGAPASPANVQLAYTRESYQLATNVYNQASALGTPVLGSGYPTTGSLAPQLQLAAFLLGANLGTRVITIHWGSFDTHGHQLTQQDPQLVELSLGLSAFLADLKARGIDNRVSVLMFSEFGRRVAENASQGTDHGAGGLMMLAGTGVKGGFASPFPGLPSLDQTGNVLVPTDFRSVYSEIISGWLGGDPAAVLPGGPFPQITGYDGATGLFN